MALRSFYLITDLDKFAEDLRRSLVDAGVRGMFSAALRLSAFIQTDILPQMTPPPVDRGVYKAGWGPQCVTKIPKGASIYNRTTHAVFVEHGVRNAKFGAVPALAEWAIRKGMATQENARGVAFAIVKSAQKRGGFFKRGEGLGVFEKAKEQLPTFIKEEVEREMNAEIARAG